jgi:4-amino-4-deoxy-L-arabinose transferase-like glycosyltransferase
LIYDLIGRRGLRNFAFLAGGLLAVHAGSFLVKTDVPLMFFEVLFFWFYKRFIDRSNIWNSLGIAFAIAGMFLSKYHGILVVLFTLLSNWRLIKNQYFWVAVLFTVILMLPHLFWLIENDFSSLDFI